MKEFFNDKNAVRIVVALVLVLCAVLSLTFGAGKAGDVESPGNARIIESIDARLKIATTLTASSTLASALVSALPDDTATPIADKLADITEYLMVVMVVLLAEKYLVTLLGWTAFKILIPLIALALIVYLFTRDRVKSAAVNFAVKLAIFTLVILLAIPISNFASDAIYNTYRESIDDTIDAAEQLSDEVENFNQSNGSIWDKLTTSLTGLKENASKVLSRFVEAVAVMIVTTCVIPLLLLVLFIYLMKKLFGIAIPEPRFFRHFRKEEKPEGPAV